MLKRASSARLAGLPSGCPLVAGVLLAGLLVGCRKDEPGKAQAAQAAQAPVAAPGKRARPPFPNMATAAYGVSVVEEWAERADPQLSGKSARAGVDVALSELHSLQPGAEERAAKAAAAAWRAAVTDADRGLAAALLGAALVLEPKVEGYKDRLTDAYGLQGYAATMEGVPVTGQAARAFIGCSAGAVDACRKILEVLEGGRDLDGGSRLFLGLARHALGARGDLVQADLRAALSAVPESTRARALLAEVLLELRFADEALAVLSEPAARPHPWTDAIKGRALVVAGKEADGVALLRSAQEKLEEARRGTALYWLALSVASLEDRSELPSLTATLAARPGYGAEAKVVDALTLQQGARYEEARALLVDLAKNPSVPASVAPQVRWTLVDACAGMADLACVDEQGEAALRLNGDRARLWFARAAVVLVGKNEPAAADGGAAPAAAVDVNDALARAHLLSPFDPALAEKVGQPGSPGGPARAQLVRAARAALAAGAPKLVDRALAEAAKDDRCRVCRALWAHAAPDADEAARRALAALKGGGPPLEESDLVDLVDVLGGAPTPETAAALAELGRDGRPGVRRAVQQALADHKNPAARSARKTGGVVDKPAPRLPPSAP